MERRDAAPAPGPAWESEAAAVLTSQRDRDAAEQWDARPAVRQTNAEAAGAALRGNQPDVLGVRSEHPDEPVAQPDAVRPALDRDAPGRSRLNPAEELAPSWEMTAPDSPASAGEGLKALALAEASRQPE
jgi:hypothetical protein